MTLAHKDIGSPVGTLRLVASDKGLVAILWPNERAGRVPFQPDGPPLTTLYSHVHRPPPPLHELAPAVPAPVCEWVGWLLAKAPDDRPASAAAAWEALEDIVVPELGPYWRRRAAIAAGSGGLPTTVLPRDEERVAGGERRAAEATSDQSHRGERGKSPLPGARAEDTVNHFEPSRRLYASEVLDAYFVHGNCRRVRADARVRATRIVARRCSTAISPTSR